MNRSEEELMALVKKAAKARTHHPTLSVPEASLLSTAKHCCYSPFELQF
jgi:hypothetical protein